MKRIFFGVIALILLLLVQSYFIFDNSQKAHAVGNTYYVSKTGSDLTGNGSQDNPWLTLQKANNSALDSDIVYIGAGTYVENGTGGYWNVTKGLTWIADGAVTVQRTGGNYTLLTNTIQQANFYGITFDQMSTGTYTVYFYTDGDNKYFNNCNFINSSTVIFSMGNSDNIVIEGSNLYGAALDSFIFINIGDGSLTLIDSNLSGQNCHYLINADSSSSTEAITIRGGTFSASWKLAVNIAGNQPLNIDGVNWTYIAPVGAGSKFGFIYLDGAAKSGDISIQNSTFTNNSGASRPLFRLGGNGNTRTVLVNHNTFYQNNSSTIGMVETDDCPVVDITNNTLYDEGTNTRGFTIFSQGGNVTHANISNNIMKSKSTKKFIIRVGTDTTSVGDRKISGITVDSNIVYGAKYYDHSINPSTHSIFVGFNDSAYVRNNYVNGGGYGIILKGDSNNDYNHIGGAYGNVVVNSYVSGIYMKGIKNANVFNNTIYNSTFPDLQDGLIWAGINDLAANASTGTIIKNNAIFGKNSETLVYLDVDSVSGSVIDYNSYWTNDGDGFRWAPGVGETDTTLADWQADGYDAHGRTANPQFADIANADTLTAVPGDFSLQSTSPAIDAGIDLDIITDYAGKQRYDDPDVTNIGSAGVFTKNYVDIGAYEYVTPPNPTLSSSTHPSQSTYYNNNTPQIAVSPTSSTTSYNYLVNQTAAPAKPAVETGTLDADGSFTVAASAITSDGVWYVHVIAKNLDSDSSNDYSSYTINFDSTAPSIPGTPSTTSPPSYQRWWHPRTAEVPSPSASFTIVTNITDVEIDQAIIFDAALLGGDIAKYEWDFGDEITSSGVRVSHQYEKPGRYIVTLITTDKSGNKSTYTETVDIHPPVPTISDIKADGTNIVIVGRSFAETTVNLTIHSNPYSGQAVASEDGKFSYQIENGSETLGEGDHTALASAAVVLPDMTAIRSKDSKTYDFNVSVDNGKLKVEMKKTRTWQIVSLILGVIIVGLVATVLRRKNRKGYRPTTAN